jgi:DNA-binding CsgD family transcriptional regulator
MVAAADEAAAEAVAEDAAVVRTADQAAAEAVAQDATEVIVADQVAAEAVAVAAANVAAASITVAEARVLRYLPTRLTFALIADKLGISRAAAKERAERAYKKLGVHNRAEAVNRARALGLID